MHHLHLFVRELTVRELHIFNGKYVIDMLILSLTDSGICKLVVFVESNRGT